MTLSTEWFSIYFLLRDSENDLYANTRGTTKGNRTLTILIPFPNSLHKRNRAVNRFVKNGKANFGSLIEGNPEYSGQKKPKWIFHLTSTEISGIFRIMKTPAVFMCWCTVAWQVRLWKFFLSFFISSNYADIIRRTFFPS